MSNPSEPVRIEVESVVDAIEEREDAPEAENTPGEPDRSGETPSTRPDCPTDGE